MLVCCLTAVLALHADSPERRQAPEILTRIVPVINWDLSVMPCCNYTYSKIAPNYLDIPLAELIRERTHSSVCANCQSHALHRWNNQGFYSDFVASIVAENTQPAVAEAAAD